ncbi:MAG TPA: MFS transporter [Propionibacteriaceae bacterium]
MGREFGSQAHELQWVITAYLLALAVFMPAAGPLADNVGRKRLMIIGMLMFGAASAACAIAPSLVLLIVCRFVQGLGAAVLQPLALASTTREMPDERRGWAIGVFSTGGTVFLIFGPLIGAGILALGDWRWLFVLNLPVSGLRPNTGDPLAPVLTRSGARVGHRCHAPAAALADRQGARTLVLPGLVLACAGLAWTGVAAQKLSLSG